MYLIHDPKISQVTELNFNPVYCWSISISKYILFSKVFFLKSFQIGN